MYGVLQISHRSIQNCLHMLFISEIKLLWVAFIILGEPAYPYLRTLLQFDTREFLNVLALVCFFFVRNFE